MTSHRFGFLDKKVSYQFAGGTVVPVADFDQAHEYIVRRTHGDGFVYPPILSGPAVAKLGPRLERAAHLYRLPASHELRLNHNPGPDDRDRSTENFLIHLLAFLHGGMFQFEDWCHDARVAVRGQHNVHFTHSTAEHFISHAYCQWRAWPAGTQRRFTNILFMLNRAPSYEWDWEGHKRSIPQPGA